MTQTERVLAAARSYAGVCQADFLGPQVCDNGPPITRVAARIQNLEERDYRFEVIGWRNKTKVYRLIAEPDAGRGALPVTDVAHGQASHPPKPRSVPSSADEEQEALFEVAKQATKATPHWAA